MLTGEFRLTYSPKTIEGSFCTKKLLELELTIRKVGIFDSDSLFLFNTIGEYCLARKTEREIGTDSENWKKIIESTEWSK